MSRRPLVGDRVIVARIRPACPVNFEGHTGRLTDVAPLAGEGLVIFDAGFSTWVDLDALERLELIGFEDDDIEPRGDRLIIPPRPIYVPRANEEEHEGHSEHLDAIEARLLVARDAALVAAEAAPLAPTVTQLRGMTRVTGVTDVRLTTERPADRLDAIELGGEGSGTIRVGRVALVPKGGA